MDWLRRDASSALGFADLNLEFVQESAIGAEPLCAE
jgi:hypothetical protein